MLRKIYLDRNLRNQIFGINKKVNKFNENSLNLLKNKKIVSYKKIIKPLFFSGSSFLSNKLVGNRIFVHFGKEILSLKVMPNMVGYKIGEFFYDKKIKKLKKK